MADRRFETYMGRGPKRIVHWEHWSNPDAESYITGVDYYDHPRDCRERMRELYPFLELPAIDDDRPKKRPVTGARNDPGSHAYRWNDYTAEGFVLENVTFRDAEEVFRFSPLAHADFSGWAHVVDNYDFTDEETLFKLFRGKYPAEWGETPQPGSSAHAGLYNTMFMWPLLCFGWELFLECCLDERFERVMDEFAELNRRLFRAFARLPVNFIVCHDDIVMTRGPVCSPEWMRKYIFSRYEEFWGIVKDAGKEVIFMVDGNVDAFVDDVFACGARGIISEPYTDYKAIASRYKNCFIAGEGDSRILHRNDPIEIETMVRSMAETGKMSGGYMMSVGNHIPWNVNPEGVKRYLDLSDRLAYR